MRNQRTSGTGTRVEPSTADLLTQLREQTPVAADQALDAIVQRHRPLVRWVARRFVDRGVPLADLMSEGCIGLMKAAKHFEPQHNTCFSTYASFWIEREIRRALIRYAPIIRIPRSMLHNLSRLRQAHAELHAELGRDPTDRELAARLGFSETQVQRARSSDVCAYPFSSIDPASDIKQITEDYPEHPNRSPDRLLMAKDSGKLLRKLLGRLDERERRVLRLYFGINSGAPQTFAHIASHIGLCSERVRQIQKSALVRLRRLAHPYADELKLMMCA